MTNCIVVIHHRHGEDVLQGANDSEALGYLAEYCREWWDEVSDKRAPKDQYKLIEQYFEKKEDEWWEYR